MNAVQDPPNRAWAIELGTFLLVSVIAVFAVGQLRGAMRTPDPTIVNIVGDPKSASATVDDLTLTISVDHPEVVAGERLRVDIALHNGRSTVVRWNSDGCETPFMGDLEVATPRRADWNGDVTSLAATIDAAGTTSLTDLRDARFGGRRDLNCTSLLIPHELAAGGDLRERAVIDVRSGDGETPNETAELSATFVAGPTATLPIRVGDSPNRRPSRSDAVAAFAADRRLTDFVATFPSTTWHVDMAWWQGGWELWVDPGANSGAAALHSLRMRYDPSTQKVVDVRRVAAGQVPGNDPDFEPPVGSESDVLIP